MYELFYKEKQQQLKVFLFNLKTIKHFIKYKYGKWEIVIVVRVLLKLMQGM